MAERADAALEIAVLERGARIGDDDIRVEARSHAASNHGAVHRSDNRDAERAQSEETSVEIERSPGDDFRLGLARRHCSGGVRVATRGEVARIVGEAYLRLAESASPADATTYLDNARELLDDARDAGEADPGVFQQLGMLAASSKDEDKAIEWLQRAVDGDIQRPTAYVALAGLRLKQLESENPNVALSAADTAAIWALLKKADAMRPRLGNTYGLGLAMWQNSWVRPKGEDLALLADGVDAFPGETGLMRGALRLFNKLGAGVDPAIAARMNEWRNRVGVSVLVPTGR